MGAFADLNMGRDAVYIADGGAPVLVRVVARRADAVTDFGDARLWSETTRVYIASEEGAQHQHHHRSQVNLSCLVHRFKLGVSRIGCLEDACKAGVVDGKAFAGQHDRFLVRDILQHLDLSFVQGAFGQSCSLYGHRPIHRDGWRDILGPGRNRKHGARKERNGMEHDWFHWNTSFVAAAE
ncbi:head-tail joining protein [Gemmobacter aquatilis]|uniref:head-tail joining protein n=1 Tax=Gemmobacter aquatilis TaxID=933059 RepID=UPI000B8984B1|nr:hypothetical protein [Gemmobacter aquatilis]